MTDPGIREWVNIQGRQCPLNEGEAGALGYRRVPAALQPFAAHDRKVHYSADCGAVGPGRLADASLNERGVVVAGYCTGSPQWNFYESTEATPVVD